MMTEKEAVDLAEAALNEIAGDRPLPKLHGTYYNKEGGSGAHTGALYPESWSVWFQLENVSEGFDDILTVYVYPDGRVEIPSVL